MDKTVTLMSKLGTTIEDLPPEAIHEILSRLPINSLLESRCVCKTWNNLVKDPRLAKMHLAQSCRNQNLGFMLQCSLYSDLYVITESEICDAAIPLCNLPFKSLLLSEFNLIGSCNGYLCLTDQYFKYGRNFRILICNPVTGEYMKLPDNAAFGTLELKSSIFGFGFDPKRRLYKVVRMTFVGNGETLEIEVHTLGTDSWRSISSFPKISCHGLAVLVNGNLHWLCINSSLEIKSIIAVSVGDEKVQFIQTPPSIVGQKVIGIQLGLLGGCLSVVVNSSIKSAKIWVMKNYGMGESWTEEFVIERPIMNNSIMGGMIRNLSMQKDGKILLECVGMGLFSYDPQRKTLKDLRIRGLPDFFEAFPHVATLVSFKDAFISESRS